MSTTEAQGQGVLVLDADGAATWLSPLLPAVAGVLVAVGEGAVIEVDAANPTLIVGWALQADGDVSALATAFGEPEFARELGVLANSGQEVFSKSAPALTATWVQRATVAAVAQSTLRPINEGALLLDQAAADHATGRVAVAANLFRMSAPSLLALGEDCLTGDITGGAATDIAHIAKLASQSLAGTGWEVDVAELARRLDDEVGLSDDAIWSALADWAPQLVGAGSMSSQDSASERYVVDPMAVPPRLLRWEGADYKEVDVSVPAGSQHAVVSVDLAQSVDVRSSEAGELIAFAYDPGSDKVLAIAPMQRGDRHAVTATIVCNGHDPRRLAFGVYHADSDIGALRLDSVGRLLVNVDRLTLDAYNHHRLALAATHQQAAATDHTAAEHSRDDHLKKAKSAATKAVDEIEMFLMEHDLADDALLERRKSAIEGYLLALDPDVMALVGSTPLLAELLDAEVDDDHLAEGERHPDEE